MQCSARRKARAKSACGQVSLQWNLRNNGRYVAAKRGARGSVRAAVYRGDDQLGDTLLRVWAILATMPRAVPALVFRELRLQMRPGEGEACR